MSSLKPLYLLATHGQPLKVQLDGPSLRTMQPHRSNGRYPFRQISRIYSSGTVEWESRALYKTMEQGITITFGSSKGGKRGILLPMSAREENCNQQLEELLDQPNGWIQLEEWELSADRRAIIRLQRRVPFTFDDLRATHVEQQLTERVQSLLQKQNILKIRGQLRGWCSALVAEAMIREGIENRNLRNLHFNLKNIDLNQLFTSIISWDLETTLYQVSRGIHRRFGREFKLQHPKSTSLLLRAFHYRQPRLEKLTLQTIGSYRNWLSRTVG